MSYNGKKCGKNMKVGDLVKVREIGAYGNTHMQNISGHYGLYMSYDFEGRCDIFLGGKIRKLWIDDVELVNECR